MYSLSQEEISRLNATERLALIGDLWQSLDDDELTLSAGQSAELDRRLASFEQDRSEGIIWEQLKAELAHRCPDVRSDFSARGTGGDYQRTGLA